MKIPEQEMQEIVEAVGECNHVGTMLDFECIHCGQNPAVDPSPTDLNELFRLAGKLGFTDFDFYGNRCVLYEKRSAVSVAQGDGETKAEGLRKALVQVCRREEP